MKKMIAALLAAALCLGLAACASGTPEDAGESVSPETVVTAEPAPVSQSLPVQEPEPESVWTVSEEITVSLLQDTYPVGVKQLTLILDNGSDLELGHGEDFFCEKYEDGAWQRLEFSDRAYFADVFYLDQPHTAAKMVLDMGLLAAPLEKGLYRITGSDLWIGEDEKVPTWQVSFRVTANAQPEPDFALYIPGQEIPTVQGCVVTNRLPVLFINTTGEDGQVLDIPHLERQNDTGAWEEVPYREGIGFCGTPDPLPTWGRSWSEDMAALWGALEDGRYRLSYAAGSGSELDQTACGEFTLYTPEGNQGLPLAG